RQDCGFGCLDPRHPLRQRATWIREHNRRVSRLAGWVLQIPNTGTIDPLIQPPWLKSETRYNSVRRVMHPRINLLSGTPFRYLAVYTDGARSEIAESPRTGGGIVIFQAGQMVYRESLSLDSTLSPFDTEVTAVKEALKAALSLPTARFSENI
ncbi:BgTH12-00386, partial [Blumeria graminis f. sp. triticale]